MKNSNPIQYLVSALLVFGFSSAFLSPIDVRAEDRGRLADGRAFRKDVEGNQLIDYIAELEVTIEGLNRRIGELEGSVEAKDAALDRVEKGGAASGVLAERDIGSESVAKKAPEAKAVESCPPVNDCAAPMREASQCAGQVKDLSQQLAMLKTDLDLERQAVGQKVVSCGSGLDSLRREVAEKENTIAELNQQVASLREFPSQVESLQSDLIIEKQLHTKSVAEKESEIEDLQDMLVAKKDELASKEGSIAELTDQVALLQKAVDSAKEEGEAKLVALRAEFNKSQLDSYRPSDSRSTTVAAASGGSRVMASRTQETSPALTAARQRAVESLRGKVQTSANQLRGQLQKRDQAYASYKQKKHVVELKLQPAVSSSGSDLKEVSARLQNVSSVYEVSQLLNEIREIEAKVNEDIGLMARMERSGR